MAATLLVLGWTTCASAQSTGRVALGLGYALRGSPYEGSDPITRPSFLWRFGQGNEGWGWRWGFNWYSTELEEPAGDALERFGRMRIRPMMVGYGYHRRVSPRTVVGAGLLAGYAFVSFDMNAAFNDAYRANLNARTVDADVSNTFAARPEASVWVDLSRKVGLSIAAGYVIARPEVTVTSSLGRDTRPINADAFQVRVGLAYSVF